MEIELIPRLYHCESALALDGLRFQVPHLNVALDTTDWLPRARIFQCAGNFLGMTIVRIISHQQQSPLFHPLLSPRIAVVWQATPLCPR